MSLDEANVLNILKNVSSRYRGPGGAAAVVKDGELVAQHVWGYADLDRRIPTTAQVLYPICSITKQFVSALLLDLTENPPATLSGNGSFQEQILASLREVLPAEFVDQAGLTVEDLVDMHSGVRDYWAVCTVQGSRPDTVYSLDEHNEDMLRRIKSLHFQPGTEYSYSNTNFNIVERLFERVTNDTLQNLFSERIFKPAGMTTARLNPRTDRLPAPIIGYEGTEKSGFRPADNNIEWSADAGMVASLADMIAYEKHFDAKYQDTRYQEVVQPREYKQGIPARYRYGLRHSKIGDLKAVGHGGALRGFSLGRCYVPEHRLSVVVLFNHMESSGGASEYIIKKILNIPEVPSSRIEPVREWSGSYLDEDTQLSVRVENAPPGRIRIAYSRKPETLRLVDANHAATQDMEASVHQGTLRIHRYDDNRTLHPQRLTQITNFSDRLDIQGVYRCDETESTFKCEGDGNMFYGFFDGCFGHGPAHLMTYVGNRGVQEVWVLADPRAMDDTAPGDWTLVFVKDDSGRTVKVTIGCWLARKLEFVRV